MAGSDMGAAWARYAMCESALRVIHYQIWHIDSVDVFCVSLCQLYTDAAPCVSWHMIDMQTQM
jgi:hypothetical protein